MTDTANINLGGRISIGTIVPLIVSVRGEGGAYNPHLVVLVKVTMNQQPDAGQIVLTELSAGLHLGSAATSTDNQLGARVHVNLLREFRCRTLPGGPNECQIALRFPLTQAQIALIEKDRHAQPNHQFTAILTLEATPAWVVRTWNSALNPLSSVQQDAATQAKHPISFEMGMHSLLAPFWTTRIEDLTVIVPASLWIENVLPQLGMNTLRLIEVALPRRGGLIPDSAIDFFETALRHFDVGLYREAMESCRDVRTAIERELGATEANPIGNIVAQRLGWDTGIPQQTLLNAMWNSFRIVTNEAHHLPGGPRLLESDARACLHLAAILLEYVGQLLS